MDQVASSSWAVPVSVPTSERAASVRSRKEGRSDGSTSTSCRVIRAAGISDGVAYAMSPSLRQPVVDVAAIGLERRPGFPAREAEARIPA